MPEVIVSIVSATGLGRGAHQSEWAQANPLPVNGALPVTMGTRTTWGRAVPYRGMYQQTGARPLFRGDRTDGGDYHGAQGDRWLGDAAKYTRHDGPSRGGLSGYSGTPCVMVGTPLTHTRRGIGWWGPVMHCHGVEWIYSSGEDAEILLMQPAVDAVHDAWETAHHAAWLAEYQYGFRSSEAVAADATARTAWLAAFERDPLTGAAVGSVALYLDLVSQRAADFIASVL